MSSSERSTVVLLVGHGAPASDTPRDLVSRLKQLEGMRRARGLPMSDEERALDHQVRTWPRTPETDPYGEGLVALAAALGRVLARSTTALSGARVALAYNELCAPSVEDAVRELVREGARRVVLVPSMFTRGGVHSEREIPETIEELAKELPDVDLVYAWPFDDEATAALMVATLERTLAR